MNFFVKCITGFLLGLLIVSGFFAAACNAREFSLIELEEVKITYMSFFPGGRDPLISYNGLPDRSPGKQLDLRIDTTVANYFYWTNTVHSLTDQYASTGHEGQFRVVGLNMILGLRVASFLDIYYYHFSKHLLDAVYAPGGFPVVDSIGFNLYLFRKDKKDSLF